MDKTALKKLAITAREKLEDTIKQKAYSFGITKDEIRPLEEATNPLIINGRIIRDRERKQYDHLKNRIQVEGYQKVMDEAVYTWFNRFAAMRYMEVNGFLPIHTRILSSEISNKHEPDALTDILSVSDDLGMDRDYIYRLQDENQLDELYHYLLLSLSKHLGDIIPNVFDPITDDLALLLPDNLLNETSVIRDLVTLVDEEDWQEVEVIGWLYQFYIAEEKESFFANRSQKAEKDNIPSATQLFTPRWIVQYMVDNSLGRLWLESHPDETVKETLEYYLEDAEQTAEVNNKLEELTDSNLDVEEISFLDPSCGSGHILIYAFEVFYTLYQSRGYLKRDIPRLILENNLYGLDIDKRAAQLATFAVVMKAREYDRRLFSREFVTHIHSIEESNTITEEQIQQFSEGNDEVKENVESLIETFRDAKLYGSIVQVPDINIALIEQQMDFILEESHIDLFTTGLIDFIFPIIKNMIEQYQLLNKEYEVVVTNPPYIGNNSMGPQLKNYLKRNYKDFNKDLFSVFIYRCSLLTKSNGYTGFMTPMVWMFISSYEKLRNYIIENKTITSLVHLEYSAFEEATVPLCTFVLKNNNDNSVGTYIRLSDFTGGMEVQKDKYLEAVTNPNIEYRYETNSDNFSKIPGSPIVYWIKGTIYTIFNNHPNLGEIFEVKSGIMTGNDTRFLRLWYEVNTNNISFINSKESYPYKNKDIKWFPISKGGDYKLYYGNNKHVINLYKNGKAIKTSEGNYRLRDSKYYFSEGITWSRISSAYFAFRLQDTNSLFSDAGPLIIGAGKEVLGLLNSKVSSYILQMLNPTLNIFVSDIKRIPIIDLNIDDVSILMKTIIYITKLDWNSFETSWDFEEHPFLTYKNGSSLIEDNFNKWEEVAEERFYQLKENEEELNRIFIDIYGLQDELTPGVEEKYVTINKAAKERDVKSFLSYLVGLMFGRYSLDQKGLAYAGGEWDDSIFTTYKPDETNIIPLTEEAYFDDDIMNKVEKLLTIIYGEESLEENLTFIAEALNKKKNESPRERIRRYFMKDFYKDHLKTYQKRPIYWQFSSGRRGAFKGLMYLHRYNKDTIERLRTDYILKEVQVLENLTELEEQVVNDESSSKTQKARAQKNIENFAKDREEIAEYEEVVDHVAKQRIDLDLDDGVKVNHAKFQDIELADDQSSNKKKKQHIFDKI